MFPSPNTSSASSALKSTRSFFHKYAIASTAGVPITPFGQSISTLSGAMTANTLKTFLSVSGSGGEMPVLSIATNDATARTIRVKITIDGNAYDFTSASISTSGSGVILAGAANTSNPIITPSIKWKSTLLIEVASSVSETDKLTIYWVYNTES